MLQKEAKKNQLGPKVAALPTGQSPQAFLVKHGRGDHFS